ncbi:MAG: S-layer homology domain-containing protein, partial [Bacillota bacterium]
AGKPAVSSEISFSDVAGNAWYAEAVRWATANHIVSGIGDGKFGSDAGITREQLALILYNYAGKPTSPSQQLNFADADKAASWSVDALRWAIGAGLFSGRTGGILDPQGPATRAEVAQMMMKFGQL